MGIGCHLCETYISISKWANFLFPGVAPFIKSCHDKGKEEKQEYVRGEEPPYLEEFYSVGAYLGDKLSH